MSRYALILPPKPVVKAFQDRVEPILNRVIASTHTNPSYVKLRDALLPKLISGDIRIREAEKVVEAVA